MSIAITSIDLGTRSYDIYIGGGLLSRIAELIPQEIEGASFYIIVDQAVHSYADSIALALEEGGAALIEMLPITPGEESKSFASYQRVCEWLLTHKIKRDSTIIAVGGGVVGDLAGFAAATIMRGVGFVQVPTTLLAQVDSSVGGKTGINTAQGKNLVGAFYQPKLVLADLDTLKSLPKRQILAGYAEVLKYALIDDPKFFDWLEDNGEAVCNLETEALAHAVQVSTQAKARIVEADERESGKRALLNLGHTFGHALEAEAAHDGRLLHGEAVAIGMVMAFDLSVRLGHCASDDLGRVESHMQRIGLPTRAAYIEPALATHAQKLCDLMLGDKKASKDGLAFIVTQGIGRSFIRRDVPMEIVEAVIKDSLLSETRGIKETWTSAFS